MTSTRSPLSASIGSKLRSWRKGNEVRQVEIIGTIILVQVQRAPMKRGDGSARTYDPDVLARVPKLQLGGEGVLGLTDAGDTIIDAHHLRHPESRYRGDNAISLGFSGHYARMRAEFGDHLADGIAGENILIAGDAPPTLDRPDARLGIRCADGRVAVLTEIAPAPPCEPFSRFCLGGRADAATVKAALQFLDAGTRGYYVALADATGEYEVAVGDALVWLRYG